MVEGASPVETLKRSRGMLAMIERICYRVVMWCYARSARMRGETVTDPLPRATFCRARRLSILFLSVLAAGTGTTSILFALAIDVVGLETVLCFAAMTSFCILLIVAYVLSKREWHRRNSAMKPAEVPTEQEEKQ